jgi:hypothetical protein
MTKATFAVSRQPMIHVASGGDMAAALKRRVECGHGAQYALVFPSQSVSMQSNGVRFGSQLSLSADGIDRIANDRIGNPMTDRQALDGRDRWTRGELGGLHRQMNGRNSNGNMVPTQN